MLTLRQAAALLLPKQRIAADSRAELSTCLCRALLTDWPSGGHSAEEICCTLTVSEGHPTELQLKNSHFD